MTDVSDRSTYYIAIGWILTGLVLLAVFTRLYSRTWLTRSVGSDDFAIIIATCLSVCGMIQDTLCIKAGLGKHEQYLNPTQISQVQKWSFIDWVIVFVSFFFVRTSVMLFVLRLLPPNRKVATLLIFVLFFLNFAITLIAGVSYGVHCIPFRASWDNVPGAKCEPDQLITKTQQVNGVLACVIDIATSLIPQFLLWNLQMKRSTKISLNMIFALGVITAALSIGRVASMNSQTWVSDSGWRAMPADTFSLVEEKCGIIFASAPAIRQIIAYRLRVGTFKPSKERQAPDEDFTRFRWRINLRDIFWYRQAPMVNNRVLRPRRIFYPPPPESNTSATSADAPPEKSMLGVVGEKIKSALHLSARDKSSGWGSLLSNEHARNKRMDLSEARGKGWPGLGSQPAVRSIAGRVEGWNGPHDSSQDEEAIP